MQTSKSGLASKVGGDGFGNIW